MTQAISKIVILGGGTAGWMAAATLNRFLAKQQKTEICVVESTQVGTVGVGEATLPGIRDFNNYLGIDEVDFIRKTRATFKLGIEFKDWNKLGKSFFHPFSSYGAPINNIEFHQHFRKLQLSGENLALEDYALAAAMAKRGRFAQPHPKPPSPLADYHYAFHFDAVLYAGYLKQLSTSRGVKHFDDLVVGVEQHPDTGFIENVQLKSGQTLEADLFIDCSGFRGLLIEETLKTGYEDWSHWLACNSAVAVQTELSTPPNSFTKTQALGCGWQWNIPLQSRMGNGYVYSDQFISDEQATNTLLNNVAGAALTSPKVLKFTTGRRNKFWNKNCVALGLASGFLEPLESTSISMIQTGLLRLMKFFPHNGFNHAEQAEANRVAQNEAERIRDFLILHYKASQRDDTVFWRQMNSMTIPESLSHKIEVFKSKGYLVKYEEESFQDASWLTMYNGFDIQSTHYDPAADFVRDDQLATHFRQMKTSIENAAEAAMEHQKFINKHCASDL
jgi:Tryptophan halogenase.